MKIIHVISSLDPNGDGTQIVAARLAAEQVRQGHQVKIIAFTVPKATARIKSMLGSIPGADQVEYAMLNSPGPFERFLPFDTRRTLGSMFEAVDIVHLHGVWHSLLRSAAIVAERMGIAYVVDPHGLLRFATSGEKRSTPGPKILELLNGAAFIHLLNQHEADQITPLALTTRLEVIPRQSPPTGDPATTLDRITWPTIVTQLTQAYQSILKPAR